MKTNREYILCRKGILMCIYSYGSRMEMCWRDFKKRGLEGFTIEPLNQAHDDLSPGFFSVAPASYDTHLIKTKSIKIMVGLCRGHNWFAYYLEAGQNFSLSHDLSAGVVLDDNIFFFPATRPAIYF